MAIGSYNHWEDFKIHTDYTNIGGGSSNSDIINNRNIIYQEKSYVININELFRITENIDFIKMDIEGGEVDALNAILDKNLNSIRCLSCEFHRINNTFDAFQEYFIKRMNNLGFKSFVLYLGDGFLRTVNFWKE
jgi:hypothetical protein